MKNIKTFILFTLVQSIAYVVLVYNFRVIALGDIKKALITDAIYASIFFLLVKRISKDDSWAALVGYVVGSLIGTYLGMIIN